MCCACTEREAMILFKRNVLWIGRKKSEGGLSAFRTEQETMLKAYSNSVGPFCGSFNLWVPSPLFQREQTCVLEMFPTKVSTFQAGFSLGSKSEKTDTAEEKKKTTKNKNQPLDSRLEICKIHRLQSMCHSMPTACSSFTTGYFDKPISAPRSKLVPLKRQNQSKKMLFPDHSPKEVTMAFKRIIRFKSQFSKSNQANPSNFALGGESNPQYKPVVKPRTRGQWGERSW